MKRIIVFMICISLLLSGCGADQEETVPETIISTSNEFTFGNYKATLPESFSLVTDTDGLVQLRSEDLHCFFTFYYLDISEYSENFVAEYLPEQRSNFMPDNVIPLEDSDIPVYVSGKKLNFKTYGVYDENFPKLEMATTFTDSWYAYTLEYSCHLDIDKELQSEYPTIFGIMLRDAVYEGPERRFDFIQ